MNRRSTEFVLPCAALALCLVVPSQAQDPDKPEPTQRTLRVLALGDPPPFRQEVRDGVRHELEAEPGTIPPRQVAFGAGEAATSVTLRLGRVSEPLRLAAGAETAVFKLPATAADGTARDWLTLRPPPGGDLLALVWRDPGKNWFAPRGMLLPDSAVAFPAGHLRGVKLLPVQAALQLDAEQLLLDPGKTVVRPLPAGKDTPVQVAYLAPEDGAFRPFYHGTALIHAGERAQVIIYRADSETPRRPAKVMTYNELAPGAAR